MAVVIFFIWTFRIYALLNQLLLLLNMECCSRHSVTIKYNHHFDEREKLAGDEQTLWKATKKLKKEIKKAEENVDSQSLDMENLYDRATKDVITSIWSKYDVDNSGTITQKEATKFIHDILSSL